MKITSIATIILDLSLPDGHGTETFDKASIFAPEVPILALNNSVEERHRQKAVQRGAQDCLPKDS